MNFTNSQIQFICAPTLQIHRCKYLYGMNFCSFKKLVIRCKVGKKLTLLTGRSHDWPASFTVISSHTFSASFINRVNFSVYYNIVKSSLFPFGKMVNGRLFLACRMGENQGVQRRILCQSLRLKLYALNPQLECGMIRDDQALKYSCIKSALNSDNLVFHFSIF